MWRFLLLLLAAASLSGCAYFFARPPKALDAAAPDVIARTEYKIGSGDQLQIFVWRNPELSIPVVVRPDGKISVPLLQDVQAAGQTPRGLGEAIAEGLAEYVQEPIVTVIVAAPSSDGRPDTNIRVIGESVQPRTVPYRVGITLIDVMSEVGGLTEFADGGRAYLIRSVNGKLKRFHLRLNSLLKSGDMRQNVELAPGDVIIIPERWY